MDNQVTHQQRIMTSEGSVPSTMAIQGEARVLILEACKFTVVNRRNIVGVLALLFFRLEDKHEEETDVSLGGL